MHSIQFTNITSIITYNNYKLYVILNTYLWTLNDYCWDVGRPHCLNKLILLIMLPLSPLYVSRLLPYPCPSPAHTIHSSTNNNAIFFWKETFIVFGEAKEKQGREAAKGRERKANQPPPRWGRKTTKPILYVPKAHKKRKNKQHNIDTANEARKCTRTKP